MSDPSNTGATVDNGGAPAAGEAEPKTSAVAKLAAHPKVKQAISYAKEHPLGAVVTVAAAAALVEVEFAVGILTGLGATALLAKKSGPQARDEVVTRGRRAIARARGAIAERKKSRAAAAAPSADASPPPPAA